VNDGQLPTQLLPLRQIALRSDEPTLRPSTSI
jgi:hypothetical protein